MIYVNKNAELTAELLGKIINYFILNVQPQLQKNKNYYDGIQAILDKSYSDPSKPCNKTVINYTKSVADAYAGYLGSPGCISYSSQEDIEEIMDILRYNDYQAEDSAYLLDALIYGVANELMYMDNESKVRFRLINPTMSFGIFDDSLTGDLLYFVRMYKQDNWSDDDTYCVDVYDTHFVKHYTMTGMNGKLTYIADEPHYFGQCPANIFYLPDEKSIFDCIIGIQDAINEILSSEVEEFQNFADCYMVLKGAEIDPEDAADMKQRRLLTLPADATVEYLTKQANDTQIENILTRLHNDAYRIAQCVDFSLENVGGGVSSGIAIRYRLSGMEFRAGKIEGEMRRALQRRIEVISGMAALKLGEVIFRDINIDFTRNIPTDNTELTNLINSLHGVVSDATLLGMIPGIDDVNAELEAIQKQKQANMSLYNFGYTEDEEDA